MSISARHAPLRQHRDGAVPSSHPICSFHEVVHHRAGSPRSQAIPRCQGPHSLTRLILCLHPPSYAVTLAHLQTLISASSRTPPTHEASQTLALHTTTHHTMKVATPHDSSCITTCCSHACTSPRARTPAKGIHCWRVPEAKRVQASLLRPDLAAAVSREKNSLSLVWRDDQQAAPPPPGCAH